MWNVQIFPTNAYLHLPVHGVSWYIYRKSSEWNFYRHTHLNNIDHNISYPHDVLGSVHIERVTLPVSLSNFATKWVTMFFYVAIQIPQGQTSKELIADADVFVCLP